MEFKTKVHFSNNNNMTVFLETVSVTCSGDAPNVRSGNTFVHYPDFA
jgi:hypothetical protein